MSSHSSQRRSGLSGTAAMRADRPCILTINGGSSSLKFAVFALADRTARLMSGRVERIGMSGSRLVVGDADGGQQEDSAVESMKIALKQLFYDLCEHNDEPSG